MSTLARAFILAIIVLTLGGIVFLVTWEIPAPTRQVEETLPPEQLPR